MFSIKRKSLITLLVALFAAVVLALGAICFTQSNLTAYANTTDNLPTGDNGNTAVYSSPKLAAAASSTCEFPSRTDWKNAFDNSSALPNYDEITEITFATTAPDGYTDSGEKLNTNIQIWKKDDTKIAFVYDGTITAPTSCSSLFYNLQNLTAINFDNFSTDNVTNMRSMFSGCSALTSLNLSGFNTAYVTDMGYMFSGCSALTSLDLSGFNTVKVDNMSTMFYDCIALNSLDLSGFNTTNVKNMSYMFSGCIGLQGTFGINGTGIKISDLFTTDNVTSMSEMFYDCIGLTSLDLSGFNTANVTNMSYMFGSCTGLQGTFGIDGTGIKISDLFTTDNVTSMSSMFYDCAKLTLLDLSCLNTAKVEYMNYMFYDCIGLTSLDLSCLNTAKVTSMSGMFYGCIGLQGTFGINGTAIKISGTFTTDNVTSMSYMFGSCTGLASLDLSGLKTANVTNMSYMFYICKGLTSLDLSDFNAASVTNMTYMFNTCTNLKTITVSDSLAEKLSETTDDTYLYSGVRKTWYDGNGGTYTDDTNDNKFSKGGTYTTVQPPFEVMAGDKKYYNTLAAAWNYSKTQSSATVKMNADATVGETLTVGENKNITLDLNGYKITYTGDNGSVIKVDGTFILNDSRKAATNTITSPVTSQSVKINGGLITGGKGYGNSKIGGAVYVTNGGNFTMNGGTLAGNSAGFGGAVRIGNGKDSNATFIMNGDATISHNKATTDGGGICVCGAAKVELKGTISDNAAVAGGGIYYEYAGNHTISGATIKNNVVKKDSDVDYSGNGGGIYVDDCTVTMSGGTISGNSTAKNGGGVYVLNDSTFEMKNGTISGNMAGSDNYGGGVYVIGTFIMSDGAISGNNAQDGGGVCVNVGGTFTMSGGTIKGNNATIYHGGGVELTDCTFNVSGSAVIKDNVKGGSLDESTGFYTGGTKDNVYLESVKITVTGALTTGAIIGVYNSGEIAMGYNQNEEPSVFFKADDANCCATALDGAVFIALHKGGTATCTAKKVCTNCGESYGEVDSTNHTPNADDGDCTTAITCSGCGTVTTAAPYASHDFTGEYQKDGTQHWHVCKHSGCTQTDTKKNHNCNLVSAIPIYHAADPTCTNGASYYYSCVCGAAGTETFMIVGALGHDFVGSTVYVSDGTQHWKKCSRCDEEDKDNAEDCSGGTATCVAKATCLTCNNEYGSENSSNHDPATAWSIDTENGKHYHVCNNGCGNRVDEASHTPEADDGDCTTAIMCSGCGTVTTAAQISHDYANSTKYNSDGTQHWKKCSRCDEEDKDNAEDCSGGTATCTEKAKCSVCQAEYGEVLGHDWDEGEITTPATCKTKGEKTFTCKRSDCTETKTEEIEIDNTAHSYDTTKWTTDGTGHWHAATCGHSVKKDYAEHSGGTASCTEKATCSECQEQYGNLAAHDFSSSTTYKSDGTQHWKQCANCTAEDTNKVNHTGGTATCTEKAKCSVCQAEYGELAAHDFENGTTYKSDGTQHWKQCANCTAEDTDNKVNHTGGTATCTEKAKCSVCQAEYGEVLGHDWDEGEITTPATCKTKGEKTFTCKRSDCTETKTEEIEIDDTAHSYASAWTKDETGHWHAATCGHDTEKGGFAAHTASDWLVTPAQIGVAGSKHKECTVCGYNMQTEVIEPLIDTLVEPGSNGEENKVVVTTPDGFAADVELVVTEISRENYGAYESIAETVNGEINLVYDVTLKSDGVTVQPDGTLTIKLRIPENLAGKNFKLFHLHGSEAADMEYTVDGNYAVVNTDKLSEFIFVGEKTAVTPAPDGGNGLSAGAIAGITIAAIIAVLLAVYIALYFTLYRKGVLKGKAFDMIYVPMNAIFNRKTQE